MLGVCWASLGNPILTVLHVESGGACGPQQAWAGRRSLGCRAGVFWLRETSRRKCPSLQAGTTCIMSAVMQLELAGSLLNCSVSYIDVFKENVSRNSYSILTPELLCKAGTQGEPGQGVRPATGRGMQAAPRACCSPCILHHSAPTFQTPSLISPWPPPAGGCFLPSPAPKSV